MTIIELVKEILTKYPKIAEFSGEVHMDSTEEDNPNFGISPMGDKLIKEDILGNQLRQHNFVMYATNRAFLDYDRLTNSNFLLELSYYLEELAEKQKIEAGNRIGKLEKLSCANAMLFRVPENGTDGMVTYQLQIYAQYKVESEESFEWQIQEK